MIGRRIFVTGTVQGVFFREWTVQRARENGVSGWVRNRRDGRVEVYLVGDAAVLERLIAQIAVGSPASRVEAVTVQEAEVEIVGGFARRETV